MENFQQDRVSLPSDCVIKRGQIDANVGNSLRALPNEALQTVLEREGIACSTVFYHKKAEQWVVRKKSVIHLSHV